MWIVSAKILRKMSEAEDVPKSSKIMRKLLGVEAEAPAWEPHFMVDHRHSENSWDSISVSLSSFSIRAVFSPIPGSIGSIFHHRSASQSCRERVTRRGQAT